MGQFSVGEGGKLDDSHPQATFDDEPDTREVDEVELLASTRSQEREIKNQSKDVFNRLRSIAIDAAFVQRVRDAYPDLALVPNARCGLWYCPPQDGITPAYFKSTDGHTNNYKFSLRRPNLHLLPLIEQQGGIILVDSTRRGKLFPDALSKTVPIWCAVLNTALDFPPPDGQESWLFTPPRSVSPSEHAVISGLIPGFAESLRQSALVLPKVDKPLRPFWIHPQTTIFPSLPSPEQRSFNAIICVSASRRVEGTHEGFAPDWGAGWGYVQGAGDDEEMWSEGLTPQLYWANKTELDACSRDDLPKLIDTLVEQTQEVQSSSEIAPSPIGAVGGLIAIGRHPLAETAHDVVNVTILSSGDIEQEDEPSSDIYILPSGRKQAQTAFHDEVIPEVVALAQQALTAGGRIVLADDTANSEWAAPLAVVLLQMFFDDKGRCLPTLRQAIARTATEAEVDDDEPMTPAFQVDVDKQTLARRLQWVVQSRPSVNPSRAQLKAVNVLFMSHHHRRTAARRLSKG